MKTFMCAAVLGFASFSVCAAPIIIDDYSDPAHNAVDTSTNPGVGTCTDGVSVLTGCFSSVLNASILGGERDLYADLVSRDSGSNDVEIAVEAGVLSFNVGAGSRGTGSITYDGIDGVHAVNTTGLGGVDLTAGGLNGAFAFDVLYSDAGFGFDINVWDSMGVLTSASFMSLGTATPLTRMIDFTDIAFLGFDFSSVGALQFVIDPLAGFTALDLSVDDTKSVPIAEPSTLALLSIGVLCLGYTRRKHAHA